VVYGICITSGYTSVAETLVPFIFIARKDPKCLALEITETYRLVFFKIDAIRIVPHRSAFLAMLESARALIRETESFGVSCTFTEHSMLKAKNSAKQAAND
jgi:hypothetical protein